MWFEQNKTCILRQYFPKGTDLSIHNRAAFNAVARQLNDRFRGRLEYETLAERFNGRVVLAVENKLLVATQGVQCRKRFIPL